MLVRPPCNLDLYIHRNLTVHIHLNSHWDVTARVLGCNMLAFLLADKVHKNFIYAIDIDDISIYINSYFHVHFVCKSSGYSFSTKRGFQNNTISKKPSCYAAMFQKKSWVHFIIWSTQLRTPHYIYQRNKGLTLTLD